MATAPPAPPPDTDKFIQTHGVQTKETLGEIGRVYGDPNPNAQGFDETQAYKKRKTLGDLMYHAQSELSDLRDELAESKKTLDENATKLEIYNQNDGQSRNAIALQQSTNEKLSSQIVQLMGIIKLLENATTQLWSIGSANNFMFQTLEEWFNKEFSMDTAAMQGVEGVEDIYLEKEKNYLQKEKAFVLENKLVIADSSVTSKQ
jgi:hypothetical protein